MFSEKIWGHEGSWISYHVVEKERIQIDDVWKGDSKSPESVLIELIREVARRAFREGLSLSATVWWNSTNHIFFLKIGMIPDDFPLSYAAWNYGEKGYEALSALKRSDVRLRQLGELEKIVKNEGISLDATAKEKEALLLSVLERKYSFLKDRFFPRLLFLLDSPKGSDPFPESGRLGSMNMNLSERGRRRWENAIEDEIPFTPFSKFEHLTPFMSESQQQLLDQILNHRK